MTPPNNTDTKSENFTPPILEAFTKGTTSQNPVWFMRQAGRSLPEYREARRGIGMLDACLTPDLAAEITCQPVRRHGVDAAVFFSDIMVPLKLADVPVDIVPNVGPVFDHPYNSVAAIRTLSQLRLENTEAVTEGVRLATRELGTKSEPRADGTWVPVLAFAGAPFTLAAYMVEGKPSKDHLAARALMLENPTAWHALMKWTTDVSIRFMKAQVDGGAQIFQLFDSWAGSLSAKLYGNFVAPYSDQVLQEAKKLRIPTIHFGTHTAHILCRMGQEADALGIDHHVSMKQVAERMRAYGKRRVILQGNLDPAYLFAPNRIRQEAVHSVLRRGRATDAHIFNLGHGVPAQVNPDVLSRIVEQVHQEAEKAR